ncbi:MULTISPECIES: TRAP transporter small permease [Rhodobacterales]|jgi:TRAP-type C4-dicarboxylate transport system permease small subunit|uniref:TRAP transporter small permease protein n=1 Tax=Phaeobacter gallaeciensis TaxID=60890 RepID=A0A1B0ZWY4_9RHOB|nr:MULTISPECIES: TRAP transporter small permease [Phaeobacter]MDF1772741.1 TRAP transporter small permease [Pseudophaeobacter sp. bin_em_oilr2.035]MEE2632838.1 TRAP transporter small permease [Pseudomonadota bacterium]ANP38747.1 C4-dicarboxylate ABC transporter permease [Phaeobacter gallaeciensis]MDE4061793.1 TRAP transporter small permease [Phaeobacter gallaeciensis]MDE4096220.1 TRAP transporter small permease [Phaeobacter gallaeciensis]
MQYALRFLTALSKLPMFLANLSLFALMCLTFADVLMRSVFNAPIEAATELIRIGIALIVFAALPVLSAQNGHIAVDLLDGPFRRMRLERWRDAAVALICAVMLWYPAGRVVDLAERSRSYGDVTEYLSIPTFYIAYFIAAMIYVTAVALIGRGLLHLIAPHMLEAKNA